MIPLHAMYFIAIILPEEINQKILGHKQWMFQHFKCRAGLNSPAHITLIPPYWMTEDLAAELVTEVDKLATGFEDFSATTANFSFFKPSTIFIAVKENERLAKVKLDTDQYFIQRPQYKMKFDTRPFHPHITIATRDLYKKNFYEAWEHFSKMQFEETWEVNGMSLLKHNKKNWDVVHTSQFRNII